MKVIGLCGGSGSGKGAVCRIFEQLGVPSIDTDSLYHTLTSSYTPCLRELEMSFGPEIVKDGALDRAALREKVFSSPDVKEKHLRLNAITHKYVLAEVRAIIQAYDATQTPAVLVDAPLLFESGFNKECSKVICVIADENIRIARIMLRDGISFDVAKKRIGSQLKDGWLMDNCDYCIKNNGNLEALEAEVSEVAKRILNN